MFGAIVTATLIEKIPDDTSVYLPLPPGLDISSWSNSQRGFYVPSTNTLPIGDGRAAPVVSVMQGTMPPPSPLENPEKRGVGCGGVEINIGHDIAPFIKA